jgi:serine/threonine protein kinase
VLVHQKVIKLTDFGLSRKIEEATNNQSKLYGLIPYIDPKAFNQQKNDNNLLQVYQFNEKSDVYSIGVILWEISTGKRPFEEKDYDDRLKRDISDGAREETGPDTHPDYAKIYTGKYDFKLNYRFNRFKLKLYLINFFFRMLG